MSPDELALLFTGSRVPNLFKTSNTETVEEEEGEPEASHAPWPAASSTPTPPAPSTPTPELEDSSEATSQPTKAPTIHSSLLTTQDVAHPLFAIEQLGVDHRLIVNRKRQLKMYRVWMQGKFRKL